jgi:hypothetical protein
VHSSVLKSDAQQIYEVLLKMLDRWNAHDIAGHLEVYWKSPDLLVVIDFEEFNGWQQLHDSYVSGYPDCEAMGVHRTQTDPGQALETGSRTSTHLVVSLLSGFQADGSGEYHHESTKV